jgi:hypothetical protein
MKKEMDENGKEIFLAEENDRLPASFKHMKPRVYKEGDTYYCLTGENPTEGILGSGATPELAIEDWDRALQKKKDLFHNL